jgi:hypothetical protein
MANLNHPAAGGPGWRPSSPRVLPPDGGEIETYTVRAEIQYEVEAANWAEAGSRSTMVLDFIRGYAATAILVTDLHIHRNPASERPSIRDL